MHSADAPARDESCDLPIPAIANERNFSAKAELPEWASALARVSPPANWPGSPHRPGLLFLRVMLLLELCDEEPWPPKGSVITHSSCHLLIR